MLLRKKAQSTAEYAITIGLVVAVVAGVLQVALKGGIRQKNKQALNYLIDAGSSVTAFNTTDGAEALYSQDYRKTTIDEADFVDQTVMQKGGAEKRYQKQSTASESVSLEMIDAISGD